MTMLTVADVAVRVQRIRSMAGDDEVAHGEEDLLHQDVLTAIANGRCEDVRGCARAALETVKINFARWCA